MNGAHALQSLQGPSPHLASSVSESSSSEPYSGTVEPCKQLARHPFTPQPSFLQCTHVAPDVTRRLQGLQTLGHLWTRSGPSSPSSENHTECPSQCTRHVEHVHDSIDTFSRSSNAEDSTAQFRICLLKEIYRTSAAEQHSQALDMAVLVEREALVEVRKENAVLQRACGYGKVPHLLAN